MIFKPMMPEASKAGMDEEWGYLFLEFSLGYQARSRVNIARHMYQELQVRGLEILAFIHNQFGSQEPVTNDEIVEFTLKLSIPSWIRGSLSAVCLRGMSQVTRDASRFATSYREALCLCGRRNS